jgi:phosphatidylinositol glycan class K
MNFQSFLLIRVPDLIYMKEWKIPYLYLIFLLKITAAVATVFPWNQTAIQYPSSSNWAVLVCTSRYWYNYRHVANTLAVYQELKRLGWPDSRILLLIAEDVTLHPHNPFSPSILLPFSERTRSHRFFDIEIDYVGNEVSGETLMRLMTDSLGDHVPSQKRLRSSSDSHVFLYLTGHGGERFLRFHDYEDWNAQQLATMIDTMQAKQMYHRMWIVADTCQAESLFHYVTAAHVIMLASSRLGESSYSHYVERTLGVSIIDQMTFQLVQFMHTLSTHDQRTIQDLIDAFNPLEMRSTPVIQSTSLSPTEVRSQERRQHHSLPFLINLLRYVLWTFSK